MYCLVARRPCAATEDSIGANKQSAGANVHGIGATEQGVSVKKQSAGASVDGIGATEQGVSVKKQSAGASVDGIGATEHYVSAKKQSVGANVHGIGVTEHHVGANKHGGGATGHALGGIREGLDAATPLGTVAPRPRHGGAPVTFQRVGQQPPRTRAILSPRAARLNAWNIIQERSMLTGVLIGLSILAQTGAAQGAVTYANAELGLSFEHPASWRREDRRVGPVFAFPIAGLPDGGRLEIFAVPFRGTPEVWFNNEQRINRQLNRTVERQWQEQILGVPMLMSRISFTEGGAPRTTLVGLVYSATPKKLNFRLTSATSGFADAELAWRRVLETLRTLTEELPRPEDPATPAAPAAPAAVRPAPAAAPPRPVVRLEPQASPARLRLGPVVLEREVAGRPVRLRLPEGWRVEPDGPRLRALRDGLRGEATLELLSTIDSPEPARMLSRTAGASLAWFSTVRLREEPPPRVAPSGARVLSVRREGVIDGAEFVVLHAVGSVETLYWAMTYRGDRAAFQADRRLLRTLLDIARLESAS
jgi:hypothetical protein